MVKLQLVTLFAGMLLQVLLISALLRGNYRHYPFLLLYAVADFLNAVVISTAFFDIGRWTKTNVKYYWIGEGVQYTLIFIILLHLLSKVFRQGQRVRLLHFIAAGFVYIGLSLWLGYDEGTNLWATQTIRNINFGSMFLNLTLWTFVLRRRDTQMLMVAAAFGMQFAGVAIGHSLRQLSIEEHSRILLNSGNVVLTLSYFLCLYTLWRAMLVQPQAVSGRQAGGPSTPPELIANKQHRERRSIPAA